MTYTMNYKDVTFHSNSNQVEALRRALEIRTLCRDQVQSISASGLEVYVWRTPLARGQEEVETVTICEVSGRVSYSCKSLAIAC